MGWVWLQNELAIVWSHRPSHRHALTLLLVLAAGATASGQNPTRTNTRHTGNPYTHEDADWALRLGAGFLASAQDRHGYWAEPELKDVDRDGTTALCTLALFHSGVSIEGGRLNLALGHLLAERENRSLYDRAYTLRLLAAAGGSRSKPTINEIVHVLEVRQAQAGGWAMHANSTAPDASLSHLVLQALDEAAKTGARIGRSTWQRAEQCWLENQNVDGGWPRTLASNGAPADRPHASKVGATAAGLASLQTIYEHRYLNAELAFNGRFKAKCGTDVPQTREIKNAIDRAERWLEAWYKAGALAPAECLYERATSVFYSSTYDLYAVGQFAAATGRRDFAGTAWYPDTLEKLCRNQSADGSWGAVSATSYALLALARGNAPLLLQKLKYGNGTEWNLDPRDAAHLIAWCETQFQQPFAWRTVDLDAAESELERAPILYFNGHEPPNLSAAHQARLQAYIHGGGTILAVACCSRKEFVEGTVALFSTLFPHLKQGPLPTDHPIWNMREEIEPGDDCIGFSDGCRTSLFVLPNGACCAWHQDLTDRQSRLFSMAGNIAQYVTYDLPLRHRLDESETARPRPIGPPLKIAVLRHGGDWWVEPGALGKLAALMNSRVGMAIGEMSPVTAADATAGETEVLWLTGHTFVPLSKEDRAGLTSFLQAGGTLIASPCCGSENFDREFQSFAIDLFGAGNWQRLPPDDPIMTGSFAPGLASSLRAMKLRRRAGAEPPPRLDWPILYGVRAGNRWSALYMPIDLSCGLVGHACLDCVGLEPRDAAACAGNLVMYVSARMPGENTP